MSVIARLSLGTLLILSTFVADLAYAAKESSVELTPIIGYRFGGDFQFEEAGITSTVKLSETANYGLLFAWEYDLNRQGEFLISHNKTEFSDLDSSFASNNNLSITYAHIGGSVPVSKGTVPVLITGGFGLTHLSPEEQLLADETRFSLNLGIATKIAITDNVSFRFGGRVYATFFNSDSNVFCDEENCAISIRSDLWTQSEVNAGITFTF